MLADTVVVPPNIGHVDKETSNPIIRKSTIQSFTTDSRSCNNTNLYISGMMVSGDICLRKEFLSRKPILSPIQAG